MTINEESATMPITSSPVAAIYARPRGMRAGARIAALAATACGAVACLAVAAPSAGAAFGDDFGAAAINDHPDATETVPALPGEQHAFWAGACDRASAPAFGQDMASQGGIGARPDEILAPAGSQPARQGNWMDGSDFPPSFTVEYPPGSGLVWMDANGNGIPESSPTIDSEMTKTQVFAPAPEVPDHCIDYGAMAIYNADAFGTTEQLRIWQSLPWGGTWGSGELGQAEPGCDDPADPCEFAPQWRLPAVTQAGARPDGTTALAFERNSEGVGVNVGAVDGSVDNIYVDLPPGFVGNPQAVPRCSAEAFRQVPLVCPPASQVGVLRLYIEGICEGTPCNLGRNYDAIYPVYNLEPRRGRVAELGFAYAGGATNVRLVGKARTNGDFGVTAFIGQIPAALPAIAQTITLWGVPWAPENDVWRTRFPDRVGAPSVCKTQPGSSAINADYIPHSGLPAECQATYDPSWGATPAERSIKPFLTNETDCNPAPTVRLAMDAFQWAGSFTSEGDPAPGDPNWKRYDSVSPAVTACEELDFEPDIAFTPTTNAADGASGLTAELEIPQSNVPPFEAPEPGAAQGAIGQYVQDAAAHWKSPAGLATAHLKDTVVRFPPGISVNPSAAPGLRGCTDAQIGLRGGVDAYSGRPLFNNGDPFDGDASDGVECPAGSKIGTVRVQTPLLDEDLTGEVVLGQPKSTDPESGEMLRLFIVVRNKERGLIAKIYGSTTADSSTGRLTTTFANNPELPFDRLTLQIEGGPRGLLAMPQRCGSHDWSSSFTPWSSVGASTPVPDAPVDGAFAVNANCGFGFSPTLEAGMSNRHARQSGQFSLRFTRQDGEQWFRGVTAKLPTGLLAAVRGVPLCTSAQAAAGGCPAASRIGTVDGGAGSGTPFFLERKGDAYLTEGYKGAPYGMLVRVPVQAGPFRGPLELSPLVVRQAIHVDRTTAQVRAVSDPLPLIHHGIPLRARELTVRIDRPGFALNPSDCSPKQIQATILSAQGTRADRANHFQAANCASLPFEPRLAMRLVGRRQVRTGGHPAIRALVRQRGVGEAGIERAQVRLPKSLALDPANAQALCEFEDGTSADPEDRCPRGSIVGRARAVSPLLNRPLTGPVFFVKNIRIDPDTGNEIRTLPMIVTALRGEIAVNLTGESSTTKGGKLVNTFADVPDAPISRFNLNIRGGRNGIITVTRSRRTRFNLCRMGRQVAEANMDGQNGRRHDFDVVMRKPCGKRRASAARICRKRTDNRRAFRRCVRNVKKVRAKRAAAKRAAKRRAGRRTATGGRG